MSSIKNTGDKKDPKKDDRKKVKKARTNVAAREDRAKAELRETILTSARELALANGFANLSIRKLADCIGYAPGTIYLYFRDRDALVREILVRGFAELSATLESAARAGNSGERLFALLLAYADFAFANPETYRLSFMENPEFAREMLRRAPLEAETGAGRRAFALVVETLGELQAAAKLDAAEDVELLAELLWTAVHGVVSLKLIYPAFPVNSAEILIGKLLETVLKKSDAPV